MEINNTNCGFRPDYGYFENDMIYGQGNKFFA